MIQYEIIYNNLPVDNLVILSNSLKTIALCVFLNLFFIIFNFFETVFLQKVCHP